MLVHGTRAQGRRHPAVRVLLPRASRDRRKVRQVRFRESHLQSVCSQTADTWVSFSARILTPSTRLESVSSASSSTFKAVDSRFPGSTYFTSHTLRRAVARYMTLSHHTSSNARYWTTSPIRHARLRRGVVEAVRGRVLWLYQGELKLAKGSKEGSRACVSSMNWQVDGRIESSQLQISSDTLRWTRPRSTHSRSIPFPLA